MPKTPKNKTEMSVTIDNELLIYIKEKYINRSKFIEYCITQELERYKNK